MSQLCIDAAFPEPRHLVLPGPWVGHIPFVQWLISVHRPGVVVELGTYAGNSYMAICQSLVDNAVAGLAFAVDTWEGDAHSGHYGNEIFERLKAAHDGPYGAFSRLMRTTFDEARCAFAPGSVDLLHIDGLHTYEAVRHDFETWFEALSDRAVVMFHDTNVHTGDFGVHRFWGEISARYPSFNFMHSHGLGVLLVGRHQCGELERLCHPQHSESAWASTMPKFQRLGNVFELKSKAATLHQQLADARAALAREADAGAQRHAWIVKQDAELLNLGNELALTKSKVVQLLDLLRNRLHRTQELEASVVANVQELATSQAQLAQVQYDLEAHRRDLQAVFASTSWRAAAPLRFAGSMARKARTFACLSLRGEWGIIADRLRLRGAAGSLPTSVDADAAQSLAEFRIRRQDLIAGSSLRGARTAQVLTTPHTLFVARLISDALEALNFRCTVSTQCSEPFEADLYFVICPQMFERLPPPDKRICYQMEQSVSTRWFTDDYWAVLKNSMAVMDYSKRNLSVLEANDCGYPYAFHLPIGGVRRLRSNSDASKVEKSIDVLFYGDDKTPRRQKILEALSKDFSIHVVNDVFGPELQVLVASAKVVLNIHYYEHSLLETTRIYECLSLGTRVVSEEAADQDEHEDLAAVVRFVPAGDISKLSNAIRQALAESHEACVANIDRAIAEGQQRFNFMFMRVLLALNVLSYEQFAAVSKSKAIDSDRIALSLPETTTRRALLEASMPEGFEIFDGLRSSPAWKGCALSYKHLALSALRSGKQRLVVCEDDVELPQNWQQRMRTIEGYLDARDGQWHIFAGLIADVHKDARVLAVEDFDGITFVTLDRMTSMVFNVYSRKALELLAQWRTECGDVATGTIDRYLEGNTSLRTVTTFPFFVGHRVNAKSSLWAVSNDAYIELIGRSQKLLADKIAKFRAVECAMA